MKKHHVIGLLFALTLVLGLSIVHDARAILGNNVNRVQDGGGDVYEVQDIKIPEVTPPSGADITVTTATNGTGVSGAYSTNLQVNADLWYAWNRSGGQPQSDTSVNGYVRALTNPNVTIGYDVGVYDASTGDRIPEEGNVSVGQQIKLKFGPYVPDNIYWFGTGYSMDSPYGEWRANMAPPARGSDGHVTCVQKDFVVKYSALGTIDLDVYIPLVVSPPGRTVVNIPSSLSCGSLTQNADSSAEMLCTVQGTGTITPTFHFDSTNGTFYYRYYDYRNMGGTWGNAGCYGNNIPLTPINNGGTNYTTGGGVLPAYTLAIPVKDIEYPLVAGTPSNPPTTPTVTDGGISCPTTSTVPAGQAVTFTATATDPDGDDLRYGFDWLNSGSVNEWVPSSGYVSSGTTQSISHSWNSGGVYHVKAKAQDSHGASSGWSGSCDITVTGNVGQCADGTDNDTDGKIDCSDSGCHTDGNAANASSCNPGAVENPQCSDSADNDGDGKVDIADPGCHSDSDASNAASYNPGKDSEVNTQCSDGLDNDGNGSCDFRGCVIDGQTLPPDPGCSSFSDNDESDNAQLSLALAANGTVVQNGTPATLVWSTTNVKSGTCSITGTNGSDYSFSSGTLSGTSGTVTTTGKPLTSQTTFTLSCQSLSGKAVTTSAVIKVTPASGEF